MCTLGKVLGSLGRVASKKKKQVVNVDDLDDDDDEPGRTAQRLPWSHEEDKKLANAWLENLKDPIDGNNKKNQKYWEDIAAVYNSTTPKDRRRGARQLKLRFHRVKAQINVFHGQWCSITKVYRSGYSDDQLTDMALEKYQVTYSRPFVLVHMWRVLKNHGKWLAYMKKLIAEEKKSLSGEGGIDLTLYVVDVDEKLEAARLQKETKMLDVYNNLLLADTSGMDEDAKAQRAKTLARPFSYHRSTGASIRQRRH